MQNWIWYGIIAAVCFGFQTVIYKYATQKGNLSPYYSSFLVALGIIVIFGVFLLFKPSYSFDWKANGLLFFSGLLWGLGFLAVAIAIANHADVARLAPIYNTNTLIAVLLGILFLKEIPDTTHMIRIISGAVLIIIGAVLVSI